MIKKIEISDDVVKTLKAGKYATGTLHVDKETGKITFNIWKVRTRAALADRIICSFYAGWVKENKHCFKFFKAVSKNMSLEVIKAEYENDLQIGLDAIEKQLHAENNGESKSE